MNVVSKADLLAQLRQEVAEAHGAAHWGARHNINLGYISLVLSGKQSPGPKIAKALGYRKVIAFLPLQTSAEGV